MGRGESHPYIPSPGVLIQTFDQLRKGFPAKLDASTLKKYSIAPNNEFVVISAFKFLEFIDDSGNRTENGKKVFLKHNDAEFQSELTTIIKEKYSGLFELYNDEAWEIERDKLIGFFRANDETSAITAQRQAIAFETLSMLSGHGNISKRQRQSKNSEPKEATANKNVISKKKELPKEDLGSQKTKFQPDLRQKDLGLTVRIEINLPAQGDQETYDKIFQSIKRNLLDV